jgi:predicted DNA-binding antitoxin AbrB/MazE fold protein
MASLLIEATYEDGVLKPVRPLPLAEHEKVQISIHTGVNRVRASAGMFGWKGDAETLERIAMDPEFGVEESRLTQLASHDTDFDRVPGITRYAPG